MPSVCLCLPRLKGYLPECSLEAVNRHCFGIDGGGCSTTVNSLKSVRPGVCLMIWEGSP